MSLTKPQLRGLAASSAKKHIILALTTSVLATLAFKYAWTEPRKQRYAEFHRNYDVNADFEKMKQAGVFKSVLPSGEVGSGW